MTGLIRFSGFDADFPASFRALVGEPGAAVLAAGSQSQAAASLVADGDVLLLVSPLVDGADTAPLERSLPVLAVFGTRDVERRQKEAAVRVAYPNAYVTYVYDAGEKIAADRPEALARLAADFIRRKEAFLVNDEAGLLTP